VNFKCMVKTEPKGVLKGNVDCTLDPQGLRIRQGKTLDMLVPVGSPVEHLRDNLFSIQTTTCRMEMTLAKLGSFQNRLTRDVVAYLRGQGPLPVDDEYRLPWYFYPVALAPVGIPILTQGGAIWGALGFGLAGLCYTIVQKEDWPVAARVAAALCVSGVGYAVVMTLVAGSILSRAR
jgi:hypothetical protein